MSGSKRANVGGTAMHVWWDENADGAANMGADEFLASAALASGSLLVRVYGWSSTTVSLGAFQKLEDAKACAEINGVPLVRRPSGGGAIVHGSDLTYAAAVPKAHPWGASPQRLYDAMHRAMADTLREHGIIATLYATPPNQSLSQRIDSRGIQPEPFFCFDRRAPGDLVVQVDDVTRGQQTVKIMGSAQRRMAGTVLQHGSLLLHRNTGVTGKACHPGLFDLVASGLNAGVPGGIPNDKELLRRWLEAVALSHGGTLEEQSGSFRQTAIREIDEFSDGFREDRWTGRR